MVVVVVVGEIVVVVGVELHPTARTSQSFAPISVGGPIQPHNPHELTINCHVELTVLQRYRHGPGHGLGVVDVPVVVVVVG